MILNYMSTNTPANTISNSARYLISYYHGISDVIEYYLKLQLF